MRIAVNAYSGTPDPPSTAQLFANRIPEDPPPRRELTMTEPAVHVTIYHNPACGTSRNTLALIRNAGLEPTVIESLKMPTDHATRAGLLQRMGMRPRQLLREKEPLYAARPCRHALVGGPGQALARHPSAPGELLAEYSSVSPRLRPQQLARGARAQAMTFTSSFLAVGAIALFSTASCSACWPATARDGRSREIVYREPNAGVPAPVAADFFTHTRNLKRRPRHLPMGRQARAPFWRT